MAGKRKQSEAATNAKRQMKRRSKRTAHRQALRLARNEALTTGTPEADVDPGNAMQFVMDRTMHMLENAVKGVEDLEPDEIWRDTMVGKIPNEWIRLEEDLRKEVWLLAGKMISLGIDDRKAKAQEIMASILAPVLKGILDDLQLTKAQQAKAPEVVTSHLKLLESGSGG